MMAAANQEHLIATLTIKVIPGDADLDEATVADAVDAAINQLRAQLSATNSRLAVYDSRI